MPFLSCRSCGRSCGSFVLGIHEKCPDLSSGACGDGFAALAPRSFLRSVIFVGLAWYRFAEGEALRCGFLFAFEPVEDCLSAFLLVFLDDRLDPPVCDQVVKGHYYCALDADPAASISAPAM